MITWAQLGNLIREARKDKGWDQAKLSEAVGVGREEVSRWETTARKPDFLDLQRLSRALDKPITYFFGEEDADGEKEGEKETARQKVEYTVRAKPQTLRVHRGLSAGRPGYIYDADVEEVRLDVLDLKENEVAVRVMGDSMSPTLLNGDIVIIDQGAEWRRKGKVVAALVDGTTVVKRVRSLDPVILASDSPDGDVIWIKEEDQVMGVVREVIRRMPR